MPAFRESRDVAPGVLEDRLTSALNGFCRISTNAGPSPPAEAARSPSFHRDAGGRRADFRRFWAADNLQDAVGLPDTLDLVGAWLSAAANRPRGISSPSRALAGLDFS
jgi:hypothetical protein